jgi:glutamate-1-semialdehyde 2,1-aminomutase
MQNWLVASVGACGLWWLATRAWERFILSRAKHRSVSGHSKLSRWLAALIPYYEYSEAEMFGLDGATADVQQQRAAGVLALAHLYRERFAVSARYTTDLGAGISDLQFTSNYRVPFQFRRYVQQHIRGGAVLQRSSGVKLTDLDGNEFYDLTGSYGVNVLGHATYKACIERGTQRVRDLGPVLGSYHPLVLDNSRRLREISGLDEVSFHMSGTEAVMQAVRLARYHTRRPFLVRFCGAYHGWWADVQPGVGSPESADNTYTLKEMSPDSLRVLRTRNDIACVLVNPLQALHPNASAPGDSSLIDSARAGGFDRLAYTCWLKELRQVCTERSIVLIFDEVFVGFRLAVGGAQEYFGVRADMVTYGKTLGGGLPVGAVCGRRDLMKRFRDDRPADICFARGTFNSHPYVMASMYEFLKELDRPQVRALYDGLDARWKRRAELLNSRLRNEVLPVRVVNLSTIWTVCYTQPSPYNWLLQFYLRAEGLALSWIGTGRLIFSLDYSDKDFEAVAECFLAAVRKMHGHGWWRSPPGLTNEAIRRRILREIVTVRLRVGRSQTSAERMTRVGPRIESFPSEKIDRRLVVEPDIMKRVGDDLADPHQASPDVLEEEQVNGPEQQAASTHRKPQDCRIVDKTAEPRPGFQKTEAPGVNKQYYG